MMVNMTTRIQFTPEIIDALNYERYHHYHHPVPLVQRRMWALWLKSNIFYVLRSGCAWRLMPHDLPPWQTVYGYY
jgi:transposase